MCIALQMKAERNHLGLGYPAQSVRGVFLKTEGNEKDFPHPDEKKVMGLCAAE